MNVNAKFSNGVCQWPFLISPTHELPDGNYYIWVSIGMRCRYSVTSSIYTCKLSIVSSVTKGLDIKCIGPNWQSWVLSVTTEFHGSSFILVWLLWGWREFIESLLCLDVGTQNICEYGFISVFWILVFCFLLCLLCSINRHGGIRVRIFHISSCIYWNPHLKVLYEWVK